MTRECSGMEAHCCHRWGTTKPDHGPFLPARLYGKEEITGIPIYRCCRCGLYSLQHSFEWTEAEPE